MLLRNYDNLITLGSYNWKKWSIFIPTDNSKFGDGDLTLKNTSGGLTYFISPPYPTMSFANLDNSYTSNNSKSGSCSLIVGSGDTLVTYDDYKLENIISTNDIQAVNITNTDPVYDIANDVWVGEYKKVFMALNDITIKEICVAYYNSFTNGGYYQTLLLYREVLETPIEVPANATVTVIFKVKVKPNSNKPADYVASASVE
jgi:hypothetical protein